ncbi:AEC family transporter [Thermosynechococcaceae cyanobacterium BACA0444]|uniref:AEC family transporter n=1 Tax=Pseudocalidococcus azoricus BACA0444 TaxID=2918990 RepID=A0AAE4JVY4_9CYAN|nr:AEC family transporter [Pseudocalidococcus azoricus]MDS3860850.1 AEC family transporter [Pseudocalidococcus azoricus BACA0444]
MTEALVASYWPLITWIGLGMIGCRWLPGMIPYWLGRGLYWLGVPIEVFSLVRQTDFSQMIGLVPVFALSTLAVGFFVAQLSYPLQRRWFIPQWLIVNPTQASLFLPIAEDRAYRGSYLLASVLGNTGFVGLAIAIQVMSPEHLGWAVFFAVTQNVIGTYGCGVLIASYYGRATQGWTQVKDLLTVPSLWAFLLSMALRPVEFPTGLETALNTEVNLVIPLAFILIGIRLRQLPNWQSLKLALLPTLIKVLILPLLMGGLAWGVGLHREAIFALVLMAGTPTAFAALILAEEYELNRDITTSSIALSTIGILALLPLWLLILEKT